MTFTIDALIVAAGRGHRARRDDDICPKQYVALKNKPVLAHVLARFVASPLIRNTVCVIHADDHAEFEAVRSLVNGEVLPPVMGGESRQASVFNGLRALAEDPPDFVMIHDGVRPFFSEALLEKLAEALKAQEAVLPVLPVTDTLKRVEAGAVLETPPRAGLYGAQTPQCFAFAPILAAHMAAAQADPSAFTDDASIAEWFGLAVATVDGEADNIKITVSEDFDKGDWILSKSEAGQMARMAVPDVRVGQGFDVHAFEAGDHVTLCGVQIPHSAKLKGHSDADVGLHALTDALYGAMGAGDIGRHFPPSDMQWKDACSRQFLAHAVELVRTRGGVITHLDVTLICEQPKIGPHAAAMTAVIAEITGIERKRISVKATTSERLGFTGRGEGIAALASATVVMAAG